MAKRTRVVSIQPMYRCPYCGKRFFNFVNLFTHAKYKHDVILLSGAEYRVILVCRRLKERGRTWVTYSDVYGVYREMFDDVSGKTLRNRIRFILHSLTRKGVMEMRRKHDIVQFRLRE